MKKMAFYSAMVYSVEIGCRYNSKRDAFCDSGNVCICVCVWFRIYQIPRWNLIKVVLENPMLNIAGNVGNITMRIPEKFH